MRARIWSRSTLALAAGLLLVGVTLGVAGATQLPALTAFAQTPSGDRQEKFLNTLAGKLNVSPDRLKQAIAETRQELGAQGPAERGRRPGGSGGMQRHDAGRFAAYFETAAKAIGISPADLRKELADKTLEEVAKAHGKDPKDVADALKAQAIQQIDQAVKDGKLPQARADQIKKNLDKWIQMAMTHKLPARGPSDHHQRGPRQRA